MPVEGKLFDIAYKTSLAVERILEVLEGDVGLCDRVKENSGRIESIETRNTKSDARFRLISQVFLSTGGFAGVIAILKFVFKVKIFFPFT